MSNLTHIFDGSDYLPLFDQKRLSVQFLRIFECMKDAKWRTLGEISEVTKDPQASISAQLRHMRKERFGMHEINKRRRGDPSLGLYEYQLIVRR